MTTTNFESHSVYPGEFTPETNEALVIKQIKRISDSESKSPYTNVKELLDEYKIEIAAPGFERDKIMVYADKNDLLVCATDNYNAVQTGKCFQSHVNLPEDADVELAIAEYRNNILELYIPKTKQPYKTGTTRIIVY